MLPFLEPKKMASTIMMKMKKNSPEAIAEEGEMAPEIMSAAEDLISAVHSKSVEATAKALQAAFEIMDSMPHVEGEHLGED